MTPASAGAEFDRRLRGAGRTWLVGADEVGRGCLAGPVVAAAVLFSAGFDLPGIRDSKVLSAARRSELDLGIRAGALSYGIAFVGPRRIDASNIRRATHAALRCAVARARRLAPRRGVDPAAGRWFVVVDGNDPIPGLDCPQDAVVGADGLSASVAAASIIAKVARDGFMSRLDRVHPGYGFARHKGYGTAEHLDALDRLGPCAWHRWSFSPVAQLRMSLEAGS